MSTAIPIHRAAISSGGAPSWVPRLDGIAADLLFDFAGRRAWQGGRPATDASLVSVTRATTTAYGRSASGIYVPYGANVLRYDDVIGGALIEEGRTNLCLRSSELDNATWVKAADVSVTANTTIGIFNTTTADTLTCNGAGGGAVYQAITVTASTTYTLSFFAMLGTLAAADYKFAVYDVSNAAFIGVNLVPSTLPTTTGWTRVTYTFTTPVGCTSVRVYPLRNSTNITGTIYIDQCQLELGSFATSPIPTTSTSVARAADVLLCTLPAALQGLPAYTLAWEGLFFANTPSGNQYATQMSDGTTSNIINLYKPTTNVAQFSRTPPGGGNGGVAAITPGVSFKLALAATSNDVAMLQTGQAARTALGAGFPSGLSQVNLGTTVSGTFAQNGICKSFALWGSRRSNAAMAELVG